MLCLVFYIIPNLSGIIIPIFICVYTSILWNMIILYFLFFLSLSLSRYLSFCLYFPILDDDYNKIMFYYSIWLFNISLFFISRPFLFDLSLYLSPSPFLPLSLSPSPYLSLSLFLSNPLFQYPPLMIREYLHISTKSNIIISHI